MSRIQPDLVKNIGELACLKCGYTCKTRKTLRFHTDYKHRGIFYPCKDCDYKGSRKSNLARHVAIEHDMNRPWPCDMCSYAAVTKGEINYHQKYVHGKEKLDKKQYSCEDCEYTNHRSNNLRNHINAKHIGIYFSCHLCDFKGSQKGHVTKHLESFHEQKRWPCDQCSYKGTEKGSIRIHKASVHMKIRYPCDQCDHKAAGKGLLRQHVETRHLGLTYRCSECDFVAKSKPYLYLHSSKKHKKKGKVCESCGAEFKRRSSMNFHHCKPGNFLKISDDHHQAQVVEPIKYKIGLEGKEEKKRRKRGERKGSDLKKSKSGKLERSCGIVEQESNKKFFENIEMSDIVKIKFEIPDSVTIKFEPKCETAAETEEDVVNQETTRTGGNPTEQTAEYGTKIMKVNKSFSFAKINHEDTRNSEPVKEDFFFETSEDIGRGGDDEMDDYDFESIGPDMFGTKVEFETEEFDFSMIEKVIVEREEERGRRRG